MRATQYLLATIKEIPKNCEIISHQLMLRAGMIRKISSGLYTWLPTGLRVLKKIENIIREEISKIGFMEIFMPITQPSKLWKQSGRWLEYGAELLRFKNRSNQEFILSPTYEEMISDIICKEMLSYKQFPIKVYQIHTKYRDEIRPRFGIIRTKEFLMKDGYSFHTNHTSLQQTYNNIYSRYFTIFNRIGLRFCVVQADPGNIGGTLSHEFQAYSINGEDKIAVPIILLQDNRYQLNFKCSDYDNYLIPIKIQAKPPKEVMRLIEAPDGISFIELLNRFNLSINKTIKIIVVEIQKQYQHNSYNFLGLIIRSDHELDYTKLLMIPEISIPVSIIDIKDIQKKIGIKLTLFNFIKLSIPLIIDYNVAIMNDFVIESDIKNKYFFGVNWFRDLPMPKIADLYTLKNNSCKNLNNEEKILSIHNSIEIGHIFQLGEKYTNSISNCIKNYRKYNRYKFPIKMGCYGIGITRVIAAIIEQHHDQNGIIWPDSIAPFKLAIVPINMYHSDNVRNIAEKLYNQSLSIGIDVFFDDRKKNPGVMFCDIDLIGIPHILIISERTLKNKEIEYKCRKNKVIQKIKLDTILHFLNENFIYKNKNY